MSARRIGIIQILLSGLCFGFLGLFGKIAFAQGVLPVELLSLRFFTAGFLILSFFALFKRSRLKRPRKELLWSIALGALGYAVFSFCYFQALNGLSISLTVLLLYLYPVFVAAGAWIFLGEKIAKDRLFVVPLAMVGLACLVWGEFYVRSFASLTFGVMSSLLYAVYILCSRKNLAQADSLIAAGTMQLSAGVALGLFAWNDTQRVTEVIASSWLVILGLALVCSVLAMTLFLSGLQKLKSWEVSILSTAEPITGIIVAFVLMGETLTLTQMIGASLVLSAFVFVSLPTKK